MARKWLEGAAVLRQETLTQPFTKRTDKRADELISVSLRKLKKLSRPHYQATTIYFNVITTISGVLPIRTGDPHKP